MTATLDSSTRADGTVVTLTGGRHGLRGTRVAGTTAGRSAGAVGLGPQTDRATANRRIGAVDPVRYGLEAVLVSSAASDPVPAILRCCFTHEPIFG